MDSDRTLNFELLLKPISEEFPAGTDLKNGVSSAVYYNLQSIRDDAKSKEKELALAGEYSNNDDLWRKVAEKSEEVVETQSKDLRVVVWLAEAKTRLDGFAGLRDCIYLIRKFIELFWVDLHPMPDEGEDSESTKTHPIAGLSAVLELPLNLIPLSDETDVGVVTCSDYLQMTGKQQRGAGSKEEAAALALMLEKASQQTSREFYAGLYAALQSCDEELHLLIEYLDDKLGQEAPSLSKMRDAITNNIDALQYIAADKLPQIIVDDIERGDDEINDTKQDMQSTVSVKESQNISSREEVFRELVVLSEYFRKTEPHSPISYLLDKAVRWGRMELPELMKELVEDTSTRQNLFKLTGIRDEEL